MKKILTCGIVIPLLVMFTGFPVFAQQQVSMAPAPSSAAAPPVSSTWQVPAAKPHQPPGDLVLLDAFVLRPLGVVACGLGLVGTIVALPFTAMTHSGSQVTNALLVKPFDYTFKRKLGDLDY